MTGMTTSKDAGADTHDPAIRDPETDIVSVRDARRHLAEMLRVAVGFRVDGPEGRVGVLTAVVPAQDDGPHDHIEIAVGLFIVTRVRVPFAEVVSVDPIRRRVSIRMTPERPCHSAREIARIVRRFLRAGGR